MKYSIKLLKDVANSMPGIADFANLCYCRHRLLFYDKFVQQGDPLCPLLLSLTFWLITEKIQELYIELQQHFWYIDDSVLVGSADDLIRSWNILCELGTDSGL